MKKTLIISSLVLVSIVALRTPCKAFLIATDGINRTDKTFTTTVTGPDGITQTFTTPNPNYVAPVDTTQQQAQQKTYDENLKNTAISNISNINSQISNNNGTSIVNQSCGQSPSTPDDTHDAIQKFNSDSITWINCVKPILNNIEIENTVTQRVLEKINAQNATTTIPVTATSTVPVSKDALIAQLKAEIISLLKQLIEALQKKANS